MQSTLEQLKQFLNENAALINEIKELPSGSHVEIWTDTLRLKRFFDELEALPLESHVQRSSSDQDYSSAGIRLG